MKQIFTYLLFLSIGFNIYFLVRKIERHERDIEIVKLQHYKNISHKEGYDYFLNQIKSKYPETKINEKYFIVYMWDSLRYDFIYRDQMKVLDSMATRFGKYKLEYVFATEMEESASTSFLNRSYDEFKNVKMLFGMDDFISGLYSLKDIKITKPTYIGKRSPEEVTENNGSDIRKFKQKNFYLIMDAKGKVLYTNERKFMILKDTVFLDKLDALLPEKNLNILN